MTAQRNPQFTIRKAERKRIKLKLGISGPAGSGKTYSSLQVAYGLCGSWEKICVIDTEQGSSELYSHLGAFNVLTLNAPYTPERFIDALAVAVKAGMEVVIIDSMSHEWIGEGGALDAQASLGGRFQDWAKVTPRHRKFIEAIVQAPLHVIGTTRTKTEWALDNNDRGKPMPTRVGTKAEQREGVEYEWTIAWRLLAANNLAQCEKDRTGMWLSKPEQKLSAEVGQALRKWSDEGIEVKRPVFDIDNAEQFDKMVAFCRARGVVDKRVEAVARLLHGKPTSMINAIIEEVQHGWTATVGAGDAALHPAPGEDEEAS